MDTKKILIFAGVGLAGVIIAVITFKYLFPRKEDSEESKTETKIIYEKKYETGKSEQEYLDEYTELQNQMKKALEERDKVIDSKDQAYESLYDSYEKVSLEYTKVSQELKICQELIIKLEAEIDYLKGQLAQEIGQGDTATAKIEELEKQIADLRKKLSETYKEKYQSKKELVKADKYLFKISGTLSELSEEMFLIGVYRLNTPRGAQYSTELNNLTQWIHRNRNTKTLEQRWNYCKREYEKYGIPHR